MTSSKLAEEARAGTQDIQAPRGYSADLGRTVSRQPT